MDGARPTHRRPKPFGAGPTLSKPGRLRYDYDRYGNRIVTGNIGLDASPLMPTALTDYVPATNRFVTGIEPNENAYDVAGNLTRNKLGELLAYDANNRQTTYTSGGATTLYHYDAQGNRVKKSGPASVRPPRPTARGLTSPSNP